MCNYRDNYKVYEKIVRESNVKSDFDEALLLELHKNHIASFSSEIQKTIPTNKEDVMAFIKLTNEKEPRLGISVDNALNYKDKDGNIAQRQAKTALTEVIVEAAKVASMDKGTVTLNASLNGTYESFFVNKNEKDGQESITLRNVKDPYNKDATIYVNKVATPEGGYFWGINTQKEAGEALVNGIDIKKVERENGNSEYLKVSVRLTNKELKAELVAAGKDYTAILSKDGFRIVKDSELTKAKEPAKEVSKTQAPKEKAQGMER